MTATYYIRCSMLPSWGDCARKAAAKQYRRLIEARGFELRALKPSVGAAVGTAVHSAVAALLRAKRDGETADPLVSVADAWADFQTEIATGAEWDDTTPNTHAARNQILKLTAAYLPLIKDINPLLVEEPFKANLGDGWELTGQIDLFTAENHLDDLKTGALARPYIQQAGGYTMLLEAHGLPVKSAGITFIKRVRASKPQPIPERTLFDLGTAKRSAWAAIQEIKRDVGAFKETGDPYSFRANPMSLMCSQKYCPAWGTRFCTVHMQPKEEASA